MCFHCYPFTQRQSVPIGQASFLELPAGMMDGKGGLASIAIRETKEECGIEVEANELIDLTLLAHEKGVGDRPTGMCPSAGGCDEFIQIMYLEKKITREELEIMEGRLAGLRNHGEVITLRVVPFDEIWKVSADAKAMWYVRQAKCFLHYSTLNTHSCSQNTKCFVFVGQVERARQGTVTRRTRDTACSRTKFANAKWK